MITHSSSLLQIIGCDISDSKYPGTVYNMVSKHLRRIRMVPGCANSLLVLIPENNGFFEAAHVASAIHKDLGQGYTIMSDDETKKVGVKTDHMAKRSMATTFCDELVMNRVRIHGHFFTLTTTAGRLIEPIERDLSSIKGEFRFVYAEDAEEMRDYLINNLLNYKRIQKPPKDEYAEPKVFYSGKDSGEDDVAIAVQLAVHKSLVFLRDDRYKDQRRKR